MLIFRNLRDSLGIATLARQMYPKNVDCLLESYKDEKQPLLLLFVITRWGTCAHAGEYRFRFCRILDRRR